jgi:hypothetical protein
MDAAVTLAWTYSPEGAIVLGEEGPVTHLGCDGNTTYDFSTGLIFKNGRYFDPNTGIWITLSGMVVWNGWQSGINHRNKKRQRRKRLLLLLLLFLVIITLAGCGGNTPAGTPIPNPTATCTPTNTPMPTLPPPVFTTPMWTPTATSTTWPTATPTITPSPTNTPIPPTPTMTPYPGVPMTSISSVFPGDTASLVENRGFSLAHPGIDLVPTSKRGTGNDAAGYKVIALHGGYAYNDQPNWGIGLHTISVKSLDSAFEIGYSHVEPNQALKSANGKQISAGDEIGILVRHEEDSTAGGIAHLHLSLKVPPGPGNERDPSFLITNLADPLRWSP